MADKIPVKAILTAGNTSALGEFNPGDTLGVTFGGTGADNAASARTNLGLGNVDNTSDLDKPVSTAQAAADTAVLNAAAADATSKANAAESNAIAASTPIAHVSDFNNPHTVTKTQLGLGNVDNTSDLSKPISTATQTALGLKANLISPSFTTPSLGAATATSLTLTTDLAVADGGTGRSTGTTAYALVATGTTATGAQQTLGSGATTQILVGGGASALPAWTTATGSGAPVRGTSPTLVTPILGVATGTSFNSITGLSSTAPVMDGTAAVGTATTTARGDHRHPTDTSLAPIASPSFTGTLTHSGDIVLSGSGKRITGDFSNATVANRVMFQTSTPSGTTSVGVIPAVGAAASNISVFSNSDPLSSDSQLQLISTVTETSIRNISPKGAGYYTPMTFHTGGTARMLIDTSGNVLVTSPAGLGYGPGAGGTVTQATSKATAVTLNRPTGRITMHNASLAAGATVGFVFNNSVLGAADVLLCNTAVGGSIVDASSYQVHSFVSFDGVAVVCVKNVSAGALSEAVKINFAIIKGATS